MNTKLTDRILSTIIENCNFPLDEIGYSFMRLKSFDQLLETIEKAKEKSLPLSEIVDSEIAQKVADDDTRSKPGEGEVVGIYVLGSSEKHSDDITGDYKGTAMMSSIGEDYAMCGWPIVVKAKPEVTKEELSKHLKNLANAADKDFFRMINDEDKKRFKTQQPIRNVRPF